MRFKPEPYRDLQDQSAIEQVADTAIKITINWLAVSMALILIALFLISSQYVFQASQALAAESMWHKLKLDNELPQIKRNIWVYWDEGECTRLVQWDKLGFHTSRGAAIEADWWLYVIGDEPPPVEFCRYD